MLKTKIIAPLVAAAAIGGYALYNKDGKTLQNDTQTLSSEAEMNAAIRLAAEPVSNSVDLASTNYEEVLRFDVYPNWVKSRWPRVSTAPNQPGLGGMRVALVTGIQPTDLTGALTYYFDDTHRVQKIEFAGVTDDATRLVSLFTNQYEFKTYKSLDAGFYMSGKKRNPRGILKLSHPDVIKSNRPGQVGVYFEIKSPKSRFPLGPRAQRIIAGENKTRVKRSMF